MATEKKSSTFYALIGIIVLQLGVIGYLLYSNSDKKAQIEELTTTIDTKSEEIASKIQELDSLEVEMDRVRQEREALGLSNDSLNAQISELKKFKEQALATGKINARDKKKLEEMIANLKKDLVAKDQEIAQLRDANTNLEGQVSELNSKSSKLGDSLSGVSSVKKDLENQLAYASILKAENVRVSALKDNGKEFTDEVYKHSKISQMKFTFNIADNKAAKQGNKDFFIALIQPSGSVFSDTLNGGGKFVSSEGEEKVYTFKQTINFTNSNETVTFLIPKGFSYVAGQYKAYIYNGGYEIGQTKFDVK